MAAPDPSPRFSLFVPKTRILIDKEILFMFSSKTALLFQYLHLLSFLDLPCNLRWDISIGFIDQCEIAFY
jgi:hypothetical protein